MSKPRRIYLDNAATSWPKPEAVYDAVDDYMRQLGAPAGRSAYREANEAERVVAEARSRLAEFIGAENSSRVVFTNNGTDSLNLALHGILQRGDHVVTSVVEHNSVLRPLQFLERHVDVAVTRVGCDGGGFVNPDDIQNALRPNTKMIVLVQASNVTGAIQPIEAVSEIARDHEALLLVDAAQSLGHLPVNVQETGIHLLAAPGHKGLLGPLGTGVLYVAPGVEARLRSVRQGGTGTQSEEDQQPDSLPDKYEAGNHNVIGIAGLGAGVGFLQERDSGETRLHDQKLVSQLLAGLSDVAGVEIHGPLSSMERVGVVSASVKGYEPQEVAASLDSAYSIQVRSGIHCAPLMHRSLGTAQRGGTIRFSPGPFTTPDEIDTVIEAVAEIAASSVGV